MAGNEAEQIRSEHLRTEYCVKFLGGLTLIGGIFLVIGAAIMLFGMVSGEADQIILMAGTILMMAMGVLNIFVGAALRKLKSWSRIVLIILTGFGLLGGLPGIASFQGATGLLVNILILFCLFREKTRTIFTDSYQEIVVYTPGMRYQGRLRLMLPLLLVGGIVLLVVLGVMTERGITVGH